MCPSRLDCFVSFWSFCFLVPGMDIDSFLRRDQRASSWVARPWLTPPFAELVHDAGFSRTNPTWLERSWPCTSCRRRSTFSSWPTKHRYYPKIHLYNSLIINTKILLRENDPMSHYMQLSCYLPRCMYGTSSGRISPLLTFSFALKTGNKWSACPFSKSR